MKLTLGGFSKDNNKRIYGLIKVRSVSYPAGIFIVKSSIISILRFYSKILKYYSILNLHYINTGLSPIKILLQ